MKRRLARSFLLLSAVVAGACEKPSPAPSVEPLPERPAAATPSIWRRFDGSALIAMPAEADDAELGAAVNRARETAEMARKRWEDAARGDQGRWAIKWAASTGDGRVEHVWVEPVSWTRHRIEGYLVSPPHLPLACGKSKGDLVSFPAEELSDWIHLLEGRLDGSREGGYTTRLLEERHGPPG